MANSLKTIMSEHGNELTVVYLHKYRFIRKRKDRDCKNGYVPPKVVL